MHFFTNLPGGLFFLLSVCRFYVLALPENAKKFGGHSPSLSARGRQSFEGTPPPKAAPIKFFEIFFFHRKGLFDTYRKILVSKNLGVKFFFLGGKRQKKNLSPEVKKFDQFSTT
jgi:hypothetical protein